MVKIIVKEELCTGCGICKKVCPKGGKIWEIISKDEKSGQSRKVAKVKDESFCLYCTTCITRCKANAIEIRVE